MESSAFDALGVLETILRDEIIERSVYNFNEYWETFVLSYLNEDNLARLRTEFNIDNIEVIAHSPHLYDELPFKAKKMFTEWAVHQGMMRYARHEDPISCPSWEFFYSHGRKPADWLIHITDHAMEIERNGFAFGQQDPYHLGITSRHTQFASDHEPLTDPGYNFAFPLNVDIEGRIKQGAAGKYYGKQFVVFRAPHLLVEHCTDMETQCVFWGPEATDIHACAFINDQFQIMQNGNSFSSISGLMDKIKGGRATQELETIE